LHSATVASTAPAKPRMRARRWTMMSTTLRGGRLRPAAGSATTTSPGGKAWTGPASESAWRREPGRWCSKEGTFMRTASRDQRDPDAEEPADELEEAVADRLRAALRDDHDVLGLEREVLLRVPLHDGVEVQAGDLLALPASHRPHDRDRAGGLPRHPAGLHQGLRDRRVAPERVGAPLLDLPGDVERVRFGDVDGVAALQDQAAVLAVP